MGYLILTGGFILVGLSTLGAAIMGYRGKVCDRQIGYTVPARVAADPVLAKKANGLVAFWCTGGSILCLLPLIYLYLIREQGTDAIPLSHLIAFAVYGFVLTCISTYPFEKIKHLTDEPVGK